MDNPITITEPSERTTKWVTDHRGGPALRFIDNLQDFENSAARKIFVLKII